jgi:hypothetical protein
MVAALGIMSARAAPLSSSELATLREIKVVYGTPTPSDAAVALAQKIGRDGNVDGLRAIVQLHQPLLVMRAADSLTDSLNRTSAPFLPEPIEALIVEFYADRDAHRPLINLVARNMNQDGHSSPQYRGHELFALLLADMKAKRNDSMMYARRLVTTDLQGIEPDLIATLPGLDPAAANELVGFLGRRRYAPAVPALRTLQESTPFARDVNGLLGNISIALLQIGTPMRCRPSSTG